MATPAKVYIDGQAGTTGLRIREWLAPRADIELLTLPDEQRKDTAARRDILLSADFAILCLPDDAAREVAQWTAGQTTRIIDASTAHRIDHDWTFGLPELQPEHRGAIRSAQRVSNPGCYSSAVILLLRPLIDAGLLPVDTALTIHGLSGYSGGGRGMIERWENPAASLDGLPFEAPYALGQVHKHVPEMMKYARLITEPHFVPAVGPFRCGMRVQVPLNAKILANGTTGDQIRAVLHERYHTEPFVDLGEPVDGTRTDERSFDPQMCNGTNRIAIRVVPHPSGHVLLVAMLDNLGKGACGMAIQSLNLMLGESDTHSLPA